MTQVCKKVNGCRDGSFKCNRESASMDGIFRGSSIYLRLLTKSRQFNPICNQKNTASLDFMCSSKFFLEPPVFVDIVSPFFRRTLRHHNLVQFQGICFSEKKLYILTEFCAKVSFLLISLSSIHPMFLSCYLNVATNCFIYSMNLFLHMNVYIVVTNYKPLFCLHTNLYL